MKLTVSGDVPDVGEALTLTCGGWFDGGGVVPPPVVLGKMTVSFRNAPGELFRYLCGDNTI